MVARARANRGAPCLHFVRPVRIHRQTAERKAKASRSASGDFLGGANLLRAQANVARGRKKFIARRVLQEAHISTKKIILPSRRAERCLSMVGAISLCSQMTHVQPPDLRGSRGDRAR